MPQENGENKEGGEGQNNDLKDFKEEIDTKWSGLADNVTAMNQQMQAMTDAILKQQQQQVTPPKEEVSDEELTVAQLEKRIVDKVSASTTNLISQTQAKQAQIQSTLVDLNKDYPEIAQQGHDMNKKMVEFHSKLPDTLRETPEGYRMAALQAAADTGTLPVARRPKPNTGGGDDFTFDPSEGGRDPAETRPPKGKITKATLDFARLMKAAGADIDPDNKETQERLKQHSQRSYNRYR